MQLRDGNSKGIEGNITDNDLLRLSEQMYNGIFNYCTLKLLPTTYCTLQQ